MRVALDEGAQRCKRWMAQWRHAPARPRRIVERGEITTRPGSRHDLFNALAWLAFPRTKLALSELHVGAAAAQGENRRGAVRDAATLLDEHGAVAITDAPELFALWRAHAWRELFEERRAAVARHLRIAVMGHGLLVKLLAPYPALTAKVLLVHTSLPRAGGGDDAAAVLDPIAARSLELRGSSFSPADLVPLPVSAWPDWDPANAGPRRFDDARVFRPAPVR